MTINAWPESALPASHRREMAARKRARDGELAAACLAEAAEYERRGLLEQAAQCREDARSFGWRPRRRAAK